jgi:hypothetical protein
MKLHHVAMTLLLDSLILKHMNKYIHFMDIKNVLFKLHFQIKIIF